METVAAERYSMWFKQIQSNNKQGLTSQSRIFCLRLNKIGKNPNIMQQKDDADGNADSNTISAVVNALAAEAEQVNNIR